MATLRLNHRAGLNLDWSLTTLGPGASGNDFDVITDQPATRGAEFATRGCTSATRERNA